ncbi:DUF3105 domain-containing protein [Kineosporia rhizophila]|uniref:DUF3105 domain-containing protein n=1 Tax=Kineosporia TaxID=49184 RepID=UPI001E2DE7AB|nr:MULTISPECIES: DUF3105 domain-containing protein [Kineosporia]MCE0539234.1 DUF3105 domain-containing protein [Kineosporia rhizophila]GLY14496.1 membrane protein [Kineosporia sp. NBRC 101677]
MTNARKARQATAEKAAQMRAEQEAREKRRRIGLVAGATAIVLALGGGITAIVLTAQNEQKELEATPLTGLKEYKDLSANHVETAVTYEQTPPVGGDHNPVWLNCGIYSEPQQNENAVHALEHGAVWITYRDDVPESEVEALKDIVGNQTYILMTPYPEQENPITLSAWEHQMSVDKASDQRIEKFIKEYKQGPQTPEPGAACTGGVGTPEG